LSDETLLPIPRNECREIPFIMRKTAVSIFIVPFCLLITLPCSRIEALGRGDQSVGMLLQLAETLSQKTKGPYESDVTLSSLAAAFARSGNFASARKIVSRMSVTFRPVGVMPLIQYQVKAGDIAGARSTAALLRNTSNASWALWVLANAFANAHRWKLADEVTAGLTELPWRSMALRDVAEMKAQSGDLLGALEMVDQPPYGSDRVMIYVAVAHSQYQSHHAGEARATLKRSAEAAAIPEDWGRTTGFLHVAEAYWKMGDRASARAVLEQALSSRLLMSRPFDRQMALHDIAGKFAQIGDIDRALLLAKMEMAGRDRDQVYREIAPMAVLAKDNLRARKIALLIGDRTNRHSALRAVAMVQASRGLFAEARRTSALIVDDPPRSETTWAYLATEEARAGRPDEALSLIHPIKDQYLRAEPLAAACRSLARSGKMRRAYREVERARTPKERIQALIGVTEGLMDREGRPVVTSILKP
jgi:tetratricopeptide (TPR) repeat protein